MIVRIGDIAAKAAMGWRIGRSQQLAASSKQPLYQRCDIGLPFHIMRK